MERHVESSLIVGKKLFCDQELVCNDLKIITVQILDKNEFLFQIMPRFLGCCTSVKKFLGHSEKLLILPSFLKLSSN